MRYQDATTQNLPQKLRNAIETAIEEGKGLLIMGGTGTGKTYAMHALAKTKDAPVHNFVMLLVQFRDFMGKNLFFTELKEQMIDPQHLFIDDLGSEKMSEFVGEFLYLVINGRYENVKRTVLSTNLSLEEMQDRYGDRLLSRFTEMFVMVELTGNDRRVV